MSSTIIKLAREKKLKALRESVFVRQPAFVRVIARHFGRGLHALDVPPSLGDDINHREKRVSAVQRRARTANDFCAVYEVYINGKICTDWRLIKDVIVETVTIHQ